VAGVAVNAAVPVVPSRQSRPVRAAAAPCRAPCARWAFTIVELIVVVAVIALILVIAVPGLSALNADARLTGARQTINGVTTQAYYLALANRTMTAVRFFPGRWDTAKDRTALDTERQHMAVYVYAGQTVRENQGNFEVALGEYFVRAPGLESVAMPDDVWAAPLESLQAAGLLRHTNGTATSYAQLGSGFILNGTVNRFRYNADREPGQGYQTDGNDFLTADDFLIICDPATGVRAGPPQPFRLRAYAPACGYEVDQAPNNPALYHQRYSAGGLVVYRREAFVALGPDADGQVRQDYLRARGRPYLVHRFSGGLLPGVQRVE